VISRGIAVNDLDAIQQADAVAGGRAVRCYVCLRVAWKQNDLKPAGWAAIDDRYVCEDCVIAARRRP
jgi:hypothetical protein